MVHSRGCHFLFTTKRMWIWSESFFIDSFFTYINIYLNFDVKNKWMPFRSKLVATIKETLFYGLRWLSSGFLFSFFFFHHCTFNAELHSIFALQYESWWESRKDTAGGGRLTAAKPWFGWLSLEWSPQHRWSCYLLLPRVAEMKLLKLLKINLMSKGLPRGFFWNIQYLSWSSHFVKLQFNMHVFLLCSTNSC